MDNHENSIILENVSCERGNRTVINDVSLNKNPDLYKFLKNWKRENWSLLLKGSIKPDIFFSKSCLIIYLTNFIN